MKILMVCPDWFPFSAGLAQSCYETCKQMQKAGHEVRVLVAADPNINSKGLEVYPIKYLIRLLGMNPIVFNYYSKIKEHIKWCDIVCTFSYMFEMNSRVVLYRKLKMIKEPIVHFYRGSLDDNCLDMLSPKTRVAKQLYDNTCGSIIFKGSDMIISNSEPTVSFIQDKYNRVDNVFYVNNALDVSEYPVSTHKKKRVIFVGRFVENKGVKLFPKILEALPKDWNFTAVGGGLLYPLLESYTKQYSNFTVLDKVDHTVLKQIISESAILVLPTYAEGAPRAVMEASACGIPSICFEVGDVKNIIPNGTGFSIPLYDIDLFVDRLKYLIANEIIREEYGDNARLFAEQTLDWKKTYPKIDILLSHIVESKLLKL